MTVQMTNTKAEQGFLQTFEANAGRLPGGVSIQAMRKAAIGAFASKGLPSRRVEEWKYTDLKANLKEAFGLAKGGNDGPAHYFVDAALSPEFGAGFDQNFVLFADGRGFTSQGAVRTADGQAPFLAEILKNPPAWVLKALSPPEMGAASDVLLNTALFTDGAVIDIAEGVHQVEPLLIIAEAGHVRGDDRERPALTALRHVIRVGKGAKVTLVEIDRSGARALRQSSALTHLDIADGAEVHHIKIVATQKGSTHLGHWQVSLGAEATYRPFQMTLGEGLVRHGLTIAFEGQHSTFDYAAASIVHGQGHADNTLVVDHKVPHCTSRELYKTVLDGQARAVFQGKVIVRPQAQKTDGKQMAQALMLSPEAEFDSKPELEIYADDVACGHGSTAAEIDPDLVFYCTSRGIPAATARALLIESFIGEAIEKVEHEGLREILFAMARESLGEGTVATPGAAVKGA